MTRMFVIGELRRSIRRSFTEKTWIYLLSRPLALVVMSLKEDVFTVNLIASHAINIIIVLIQAGLNFFESLNQLQFLDDSRYKQPWALSSPHSDKYSPHVLSRELLFATDGDHSVMTENSDKPKQRAVIHSSTGDCLLGLKRLQWLYGSMGFHLQVLPDGHIGGVPADTDDSLLELSSVQLGMVSIFRVTSQTHRKQDIKDTDLSLSGSITYTFCLAIGC
ncbi:hypothetical protein STEG23_016616, partial [Scotinomys teguina]